MAVDTGASSLVMLADPRLLLNALLKVMEGFKGALQPGALVISVVAGVTIDSEASKRCSRGMSYV